MDVNLEVVKKIAADVLYLEDPAELSDDVALGDHGFSSIDYIDMCFEFKNQISDKITPENLWPFDAMVTKEEYFDGEKWTEAGWKKVCKILEIESNANPLMANELVIYFTPAVLSKRVAQILNG
ncbi:hypothetical protein [Agrobacterium rosae]|uniref:hypothetical protein n=1 Tax=Agrobacterium rosae TaxID=1972867 RepID=UPI003A8084E8